MKCLWFVRGYFGKIMRSPLGLILSLADTTLVSNSNGAFAKLQLFVWMNAVRNLLRYKGLWNLKLFVVVLGNLSHFMLCKLGSLIHFCLHYYV